MTWVSCNWLSAPTWESTALEAWAPEDELGMLFCLPLRTAEYVQSEGFLKDLAQTVNIK